jgi:YidC/Oxa1 family membrane protein insertase
MERRVLLAIFLCFLVLYAWQALFVKPAPKRPATAPAGETAGSAPGSNAIPAPGPAAGAAATAPAPPEPATPEAAPLVGDTAERDVRLETDQVLAVFTNRGGRLKSWRLKRYLDPNNHPVELIPTDLASSQPLPFTLMVADQAANGRLNSAVYAVRQGADGVTFEYRDSAGLHAVKEFRFGQAPFTLSFRAAVTDGDRVLDPTIVWGPGLGDSDSQTGRYAVKPGGLLSTTGKVTRLTASSVAKQSTYEQDFEYVGVDDHYFMALALKPGAAKVVYQPLTIPPPAGSKSTRDLMSYSLDPANHDQTLTFYIGPKDFETLAAMDRNLVKAINFGMFSVLVVPLLRSLNWIHQYVGNYGWAIVALTVLINLVLFPLNHKSVVSMRKMQEIQPQAKAIQDRYKNLKTTDPARQKMNQELMALYRERGVNPASGCIPILLTLPVFFAFYAMLQTAIELRGAPFGGWIHDLSAPDPFYVLPILVGLSQILQQWITPTTGVDPAQQKMMMIMPIVLIFVFIATPAGALIYWFVGNVWRIAQMQLTNYLIGPPTVRTIRPPAERRVKRVGSGRTEGAAKES